jgi:hypothetical protein
MRSNQFLGYGRPFLRWQEGHLVNENNPVPRQASHVLFLNRTLPLLLRFDSVRLATKALHKATGSQDHRDEELRAVVAGIFADLWEMHRSNDRLLVLVYLPTLEDHAGDPAPQWRRLVQEQADRQGIPFVDLIPELRKLPTSEVASHFIPFGTVELHGAEGHYSVKGNTYIADVLATKLAEIPEVSNHFLAVALAQKPDPPASRDEAW